MYTCMHHLTTLLLYQMNSAIRSSFFNCSLTAQQRTLGHCYQVKTSIIQVYSLGIFCKIVVGFNTFFSSLIILLTYSWSLLQCTMILAETVHVHLDSCIQNLSLSYCIFIILRLSYIEIKLHTSTFITENLRCII